MSSIWGELKRRNVVRVAIAYVVVSWVLLQIADVLISLLNLPDTVGRTVFLLIVIGFPFALLFAWVFELTPDGIKRERDVDRSLSVTSQTARRIDRLTIGVLAVAVAMLLFDKFVWTDVEKTPQTIAADTTDTTVSIAVLPFTNMSDEPGSSYFSDGLSDTLLHMLAQVSNLRVAARSSSFQFRDQSVDIAQIGARLNVAAILEGSVQKADDKIRVTAQLVDVDTGFHLWSGNYDRELVDVFRIQDEIATEVVAALKLSLLNQANEPLEFEHTDDIDAYTEYLLAVDALASQNTESLTKAVGHLQETIRRDPNYAQALAMLGLVYLELEDYGMLEKNQSSPLARDSANRALDRSPNLPAAITVLAEVARRDGELEKAAALFDEALAAAPNDTLVLGFYANYLAQNELRLDDANSIRRRMISLDPLYESTYIQLAAILATEQKYADAKAVLADLDRINANNPSAVALRSRIEMRQKNLAEAVLAMQRAAALDLDDPELPYQVGWMYLAMDMPEEANRWFDRAMEADPQHPVSRFGPHVLQFYLQEDPETGFGELLALLEEGLSDRRSVQIAASLIMAEYAVETGNSQRALDAIDRLHPQLFDDPPRGLIENDTIALIIGWLLIENGDADRATTYLHAARKRDQAIVAATGMTRNTSIWIETLLGNIDDATAMLERFEQNMYYQPANAVFVKNSLLYDPLRETTEFQALQDKFEQNASEQRQILEAIIDNTAH